MIKLVGWFGLVLLQVLAILKWHIIEVGILVLLFGIVGINVMFDSIVDKAFIRGVKHGRRLEITRHAFGTFFNILNVVVGVVGLKLRGK